MTDHAHTEHIPGCYRCDLSRDETKAIREADFVRAEETRHCPRCGAEPGAQCRTATGRWRRNPHKARATVHALLAIADRLAEAAPKPNNVTVVDSGLTVPDPLDENDHRDRLDTDGDRLSRRANGLWSFWDEVGMFTLASAEERYGPLRFAVDEPQEAASSHETPPSTPAGPQGGAVEPPPCDSQVVNLDQAKAAPEGVGSTDRGLTHSLELTKEGLMPNRTHVTADESSELLDCIISATMGQRRGELSAFDRLADGWEAR